MFYGGSHRVQDRLPLMVSGVIRARGAPLRPTRATRSIRPESRCQRIYSDADIGGCTTLSASPSRFRTGRDWPGAFSTSATKATPPATLAPIVTATSPTCMGARIQAIGYSPLVASKGNTTQLATLPTDSLRLEVRTVPPEVATRLATTLDKSRRSDTT